MFTCPVCLKEYEAIQYVQPKDGYLFECPDCGMKTITHPAIVNLRKFPKDDPRRIELIKYIQSIRNQRINIDQNLLEIFDL